MKKFLLVVFVVCGCFVACGDETEPEFANLSTLDDDDNNDNNDDVPTVECARNSDCAEDGAKVCKSGKCVKVVQPSDSSDDDDSVADDDDSSDDDDNNDSSDDDDSAPPPSCNEEFLAFDDNNCGKCGNKCAAQEYCEKGKCKKMPVPPPADDDDDAGDDDDDMWCLALTCECGYSSPEVCDGKDNDCDGQTDEDFNVGQSCTVGVGACQASGTFVCKSDKFGTECSAVPKNPTAEICDGIDNDCDGIRDEYENICLTGKFCRLTVFGYRCVVDCDQTISCYNDEVGDWVCIDPQSDSSNCGYCGVVCPEDEYCDDGECEPIQPPTCEPTEELCDGKDNDCDGKVDEGQLCPDGQVCTSGACFCPAGEEFCAGNCVKLQTDKENCGQCGKACLPDEFCKEGICLPPPICEMGKRRLDYTSPTEGKLKVRTCAGGILYESPATATSISIKIPSATDCFQVDVDANADGQMKYADGDSWACNYWAGQGRIDGEIHLYDCLDEGMAETERMVIPEDVNGAGECVVE